MPMSTNGPAGRRRGGDREAVPALGIVAGIVRRRIIHEVAVAIVEDEGRPEVLRFPRPARLFRQRVAEMLPVDEVGRAGDLDVDPFAVAQRLRRIGIIKAVGREDHRRVGKIRVEDRIDVGARYGRGNGSQPR